MRASIRQRLSKLEQHFSTDQGELVPSDGFQVVSESGVVLMENRARWVDKTKRLAQVTAREFLEAAERVYEAIGASYSCPEKMPETPEELEREYGRMADCL